MYQSAFSPLVIDRNTVLVDIWIGDSLMFGEKATASELLETVPASFSTSKIWGKIDDKTNRYNATGTFSFIDLPRSYEAASSSTEVTYPAVGSALAHVSDNLFRVTSDAEEDYHHVFALGISSSAANDDTVTVATKAAHWSPLVTGAGTGTDFGALQLLKEQYITPGMQELQARGVNIKIGGLYVSINNDANSAYSQAVADSFPMHMIQIIQDLEAFLEVSGIPTVFLGPPYVDGTTAYTRLDGLVAQQQALTQVRPRTMFVNGRRYGTASDKIHFSAQSTVDLGREATRLRYGLNAPGFLDITKSF